MTLYIVLKLNTEFVFHFHNTFNQIIITQNNSAKQEFNFKNQTHYILGLYLTQIFIIYIYIPTPPHKQDTTQGQFLGWSSTGLNSVLSPTLVVITRLKSSTIYP